MKDKIIKGLIRGACLSVFYLIFDYISRNWGLAETRQNLYILIMILYLFGKEWTQKKAQIINKGFEEFAKFNEWGYPYKIDKV